MRPCELDGVIKMAPLMHAWCVRNTFNQQVGMWRAELGAPGDGVLHRECENQARGDPKCRKGEAVEPVRSTMFASQVGM